MGIVRLEVRRRPLLISLLAASCLASPAFAQTESPAQAVPSAPIETPAQTAAPVQEASGGDIVVTAQKRSERLQDVPIAMTVLDSRALSNRQINDTMSLTKVVPSLSFQGGSSPANTTFRLRGVGSSVNGQGIEPSVGLVVDGVVAARTSQLITDFADIERIEVLRGPQGTLFGKNSTAGVISIVTARPSHELEGNVEATVAEKDEYRIKGSISGPLTDNLRARVSGFYNTIGGYFHNVVQNKEEGGSKAFGIRGKIEYDATSNLNLLLTADYYHLNANCCVSPYIRVDTPVLRQVIAPVVASLDNRDTDGNADTFANSRQFTASLNAGWDLGSATITSISAFQRYTNSQTFEFDSANTPTPLFLGTGLPYVGFDNSSSYSRIRNFTQELRIASKGSRRLSYVAGIFYSNLDVIRDTNARRVGCTAGTLFQACPAPVYVSRRSAADLKSQSISAFGQLDYKVFDRLTLTGGLRVQHETISQAGVRVSPDIAGDSVYPASASTSGYISAKDNAVTGKAGLKYEFSRNAQMYGSYTRGYKGMGLDTEGSVDFANQRVLQPEHVNAYEIGFKGKTRDNTLSVNLAIFRSDYTNLQVSANRFDSVTGAGSIVPTNAGRARTQGVEFEAVVRPSSHFSVNAGVAYVDSSVDIAGLNCPLQFQAAAQTLTGNFPSNTCYRSRVPNSAGVLVTSGIIQDVVGGVLPASPKWRINVSPRYEQELGASNVVGFLQFDLGFQSKQQLAMEQDPLLVQPAYTLVDATIGGRTSDGRYSLSFFVKNMFDQNYVTRIQHSQFIATTASPNDLTAYFNKDANRYVGAVLAAKF